MLARPEKSLSVACHGSLWSFCTLLTGYSLLLYSSKIEPISQQAEETHADEEKDSELLVLCVL